MRPRAEREWPVGVLRTYAAANQCVAVSPGIDDALTDFITRRKREMADAWY